MTTQSVATCMLYILPSSRLRIVQQNTTTAWYSQAVLFFYRQQNPIPNLKFNNPMVLVIVSLLSLLYIIYSSLGHSNKLPNHGNKLRIHLYTIKTFANPNVYGVNSFYTKSNPVFYAWSHLVIQCKLNQKAVRFNIRLYPGHFKIVGSSGSAPRCFESSLSANILRIVGRTPSEAWYPAKPTALNKRKQWT